PANRIGGKKRATVPGLEAGASNESTDKLNLVQQFPARHAHKMVAANFAEYHAAIGAFELGKNRFKKIEHEIISEPPRERPAKSRNAQPAELDSRSAAADTLPRKKRRSAAEIQDRCAGPLLRGISPCEPSP